MIVPDLELCLMVCVSVQWKFNKIYILITCQKVEGFYSKLGAEAGAYFRMFFDGDEVSLDIPEEGILLPSGWSLTPLVYPLKVITCSMFDCESFPPLILLVFHTP